MSRQSGFSFRASAKSIFCDTCHISWQLNALSEKPCNDLVGCRRPSDWKLSVRKWRQAGNL